MMFRALSSEPESRVGTRKFEEAIKGIYPSKAKMDIKTVYCLQTGTSPWPVRMNITDVAK